MNESSSTEIEPTQQTKLLYSLLRTRIVEERIVSLYAEQEMRCPTHISIGQEAVAVGICAHLHLDDFVMSAHRSHAHYLAKGGDLKAMLAELYGKATGCAGGKGGSMHLIDRKVGFLGCVPIVGSTIPIGVGVALGTRMQAGERITVIFFGDGAAETGVFYESLNYAAMKRLPILFICENNLYSVNTGLDERQPAGSRIIDVAQARGIRAMQADGQDVEVVYETAASMVAELRTGQGPVFLEYLTYRWFEHCGPLYDLHLGFRPEGEYQRWQQRDPVATYRDRLLENEVIGQEVIAAMHREIEAEVDEAVAYAKSSQFPARDQLTSGVFAD